MGHYNDQVDDVAGPSTSFTSNPTQDELQQKAAELRQRLLEKRKLIHNGENKAHNKGGIVKEEVIETISEFLDSDHAKERAEELRLRLMLKQKMASKVKKAKDLEPEIKRKSLGSSFDHDERYYVQPSPSTDDEVDARTPDIGDMRFEDMTEEQKGQLSPDELHLKEQQYQQRLIARLPPFYPGIFGSRSVKEYKFIRRIEEGTFGIVYEALELDSDVTVALKRLKLNNEKEGFPITSLREINMLMKCRLHKNIVRLIEVVTGSTMDKFYLVMEYVPHDVRKLIKLMVKKNKHFTIAQTKTLMLQLLSGISFMHSEWVIHRDLKPSNLLLTHDNVLKIGDFGLCREYGDPLKPYTPVVVTLWYRCPELLLGAKLYSTKVDMWSIGCIFGEFLKLKPMFQGSSEIDQLNKIFLDTGVPNETVWPGYKDLPGIPRCIFPSAPFNQFRSKYLKDVCSENGLDLLQRLLALCPERRISAEEALKHKFFTEKPEPASFESFPTWPENLEKFKNPPILALSQSLNSSQRILCRCQGIGFTPPSQKKPSKRSLFSALGFLWEPRRSLFITIPWRTSTASWKKESDFSSSNTVIATLKKDSIRSLKPQKKMKSQQGYQSLIENDSLFKQAFKKYKKRNGKVDLDDVIDVKMTDSIKGIVCRPIQTDLKLDNVGIGLRPISEWSLATLTHRPGLYILNNIITEEGQIELAKKCLLEYSEPPNVTNLTVDGSYNQSDVFLNRSEKLRWVTMGNDYNWTDKIYADRPRNRLPDEIVKFADLVSRILGLGPMAPDAVIMNFYPSKATLSPHVDRSERSIEKPLISISLGQSAIYLSGGASLDDPIDPILLHSGDVLVMHGAQRLVYHAVPRILKLRRFSKMEGINERVLEYINNCRLNITIRQVDERTEDNGLSEGKHLVSVKQGDQGDSLLRLEKQKIESGSLQIPRNADISA
ncbi:unnamed protein product [Bursaphelenchus xylophilus]|uniref:cyclin-dependent kinase n=1 Tax=Bursaphelenchus xylophilus TaxID=6326 RepID=A0A1I7SWJ0_BURXY|nr:unnamed protein product [Bursaphelenchus xylophilus]CAG9099486.1 unnamed protein product [Bursaphelenchus xylophilus]